MEILDEKRNDMEIVATHSREIDHPLYEELNEEAEFLLKERSHFVKKLYTAYYDSSDRPIARGWRWIVHMLAPPLPCPYASMPIKLELNFHDYAPYAVPQIWFMNIVNHPMVDDDRYVSPLFYQRLKDSSIVQLVEQVYKAFQDPYSLVPQYDKKQIIQAWSEHDPHCKCVTFPMSYDKLMKLPIEEREKYLGFSMKYLNERMSRMVTGLLDVTKTQRDIVQNYNLLHGELFSEIQMYSQHWFVKSFKEALKKGDDESLRSILTEEIPNVYSFDIFTEEFCRKLTEEVKNFEDSRFPKSRPNSMNNYGVILNSIGMEPVFDKLLELMKPLTRLLYPKNHGDSLDHHHTFIVQYKMGKDLSLDMHTDDSEVTLNVNIHDDFEGAPLHFCGTSGEIDLRKHKLSYVHKKGKAIIHAGTQRHGAAEITAGERYNLIVWFRSSKYRSNPKDLYRGDLGVKPDQICLSKTHDPDYKHWQEYSLKN